MNMTNYILAYYQGLKDGTIVAGQWVRLWYALVVQRLESGVYIYSAKRAEKVIKFVERFCRHHEGRLAPQRMKLELWQKAFIAVVFGILDSNGDRRFREVVLVIARKNGKTLLASALSAYCAYADGEYGARIYYAAPKLDQAGLCYDAAFQMITKEPELEELARKRRSDIYIEATNTSLRPLAFNAKKSDGLNVSFGVCDEIASWVGDAGLKFYEVLKSSLGARRQPMLLSISTAGYENDGAFDELIMRSTAVLLGSSKETRLAPFLYTIDDIDKWNDINELRKSNPNMGVSVSVDYLLEEINIAEGSLSKRREFLVKYCNIKQNSVSSWLRTQDVEKARGAALRLEDFTRCYCVGGIDLSQTTDLTSCCIVVEKDGELYVFSQFLMPEKRLHDAEAEDGVPYDIFRQKGLLTLSGEHRVNYRDCYQWFVDIVRRYELLPLQIGYDRYCAQYLVDDMQQAGFHMDDVFQGTNLTPVIREFEGLLKDGKIHIGNNDLLAAHMLNSALKLEADSHRVRLVKTGQRTRIDGMAALLDAMCVRQKWYGQIGGALKNAGR